MPEEHYKTIEYYETSSEGQKENAKDSLTKLNKTHDDDLNRASAAKLYMVLKALHPEKGKRPTKRFIMDFFTRQHGSEIR